MTDLPANSSIKNWPEGERPREKLIQYGAESLTDAELLAILLRVGKAGSSAIDMGRQLIDKLNGICGIDRAHVEDLLKYKGLGLAKTAQLKAAIEIGKRVRRQNALPVSFDSAHTIAAFCFPKFEGKRHEIFLALLLDGQNNLLAERVISEGIPTQSVVYTRKIMEEALRVSASSIVDMGTQEGGTFPIHNKMYEAIAGSEIIICDLTGHRPNVYVEAGYALKHHEQNRLIYIFEPQDTNDRVPFDLNTFKYFPISQAAEIPGKLKPEIMAVLKDAGATIDGGDL